MLCEPLARADWVAIGMIGIVLVLMAIMISYVMRSDIRRLTTGYTADAQPKRRLFPDRRVVWPTQLMLFGVHLCGYVAMAYVLDEGDADLNTWLDTVDTSGYGIILLTAAAWGAQFIYSHGIVPRFVLSGLFVLSLCLTLLLTLACLQNGSIVVLACSAIALVLIETLRGRILAWKKLGG